MPIISTVKDFAKKNKDNNTWPSSEAAIWSIRQNRDENGFAEAFITMGRRVLINEDAFWKILLNRKET